MYHASMQPTTSAPSRSATNDPPGSVLADPLILASRMGYYLSVQRKGGALAVFSKRSAHSGAQEALLQNTQCALLDIQGQASPRGGEILKADF